MYETFHGTFYNVSYLVCSNIVQHLIKFIFLLINKKNREMRWLHKIE